MESGKFTISTHRAGLADILRCWETLYYPTIIELGIENFHFKPLYLAFITNSLEVSSTTGIQQDFPLWDSKNFSEIRVFDKIDYNKLSDMKKEVLQWIHERNDRGAILEFHGSSNEFQWDFTKQIKPNFRQIFQQYSSIKELKNFTKKENELWVTCHVRRGDIAILQNPENNKWVHGTATWGNPLVEYNSFEEVIQSVGNHYYRAVPPTNYVAKLQEIWNSSKTQGKIMKTFILSDGYDWAISGLRCRGFSEETCQKWKTLAHKEFECLRIGDEIVEIIGYSDEHFIKALDIIFSTDVILFTSGIMIDSLLPWFHRTGNVQPLRL